MLSGKRFILTRPTVAVQLVSGTPSVITVPTDEIISVLSGPNQNGRLSDKGLVYALWQGCTVALFAVDVEARGVEIIDPEGEGFHKKSARA